MAMDGPSGIPGWIAHRLMANYWLLAVLAVLAAIPFAMTLLWLDAEGATDWLAAHDALPVVTSDTAKDVLGVAAGINAAFITLYFSITLIVLSLAASNLGVRLIDRWLEKPLVRVSLGGLSFTLVLTLVAMLRIDPEAAPDAIPQLTIGVAMVLQAVNLAMLSVSLHELGRTMFVDLSIHRIACDGAGRAADVVGKSDAGRSALPNTITAPREGYVENVDCAALCKLLEVGGGTMRVAVAPGQHVLEGEVLVQASGGIDEDKVLRALPIGPYRSDSQGIVFRIRLLVEIAARALSPAVNDFYTALACADRIARLMDDHAHSFVARGETAVFGADHRLQLAGQDFVALFDKPLAALRQAAADYPSVSIRLIENYARVAARAAGEDRDDLAEYLRELARQMRDHAVDRATLERDIADLDHAMARFDIAPSPAPGS